MHLDIYFDYIFSSFPNLAQTTMLLLSKFPLLINAINHWYGHKEQPSYYFMLLITSNKPAFANPTEGATRDHGLFLMMRLGEGGKLVALVA